MPTVVTTLEETDKSILSSVYNKIVADIAEVIKLPKDTLTVLYKDQEVTLTDAKSNANINQDPSRPSVNTKRKIYARITENYNEDDLTSTQVGSDEFFPIFHDPDIAVKVAPVYIMTDVEIEFTYRTPSKSEAKRVRDDIRLRLSQHRDISHHEVDYSIIIPKVVEDFIADVHEIKNRDYPSNLAEYLFSNSTNRLHTVTDMSNAENIRLAVAERQTRIVGVFDFSSMPEKHDSNNDESYHDFKFNYKFTLSVPKAVSMRYPVMFCNQVMPAKYVEFIEENRIKSKEEFKQNHNYIGRSLASLSKFEAHRQIQNQIDVNYQVPIPLFDDFLLREGHKGYGVALSVLVEVDETDYKSVLNLTDIDPYEITQPLLNYIKEEEYKHMTVPYQSFLYLGAHQPERYFDAPILEMDSELNIKSRRVINTLRPFRITLSVLFDLTRINQEAIIRLIDRPEIFIVFLSEYISSYNAHKDLIDQQSNRDRFIWMILSTIRGYLDKDLIDNIKDIFDIIKEDSYLDNLVKDIIKDGHPSLAEDLIKNEIIDRSELNNSSPNKGKTGETDSRYYVSRGISKTVMTGSITAFRMKDLPNQETN